LVLAPKLSYRQVDLPAVTAEVKAPLPSRLLHFQLQVNYQAQFWSPACCTAGVQSEADGPGSTEQSMHESVRERDRDPRSPEAKLSKVAQGEARKREDQEAGKQKAALPDDDPKAAPFTLRHRARQGASRRRRTRRTRTGREGSESGDQLEGRDSRDVEGRGEVEKRLLDLLPGRVAGSQHWRGRGQPLLEAGWRQA